MSRHRARPTAAVVGAGVAGLTAAYVLARQYDVTLYEAVARLGGHAHTHDVTDSLGRTFAIDTGFVVHNDRTYPTLRRLFAELDVATRPTEMSMSISHERLGLEFAGGRGARGLFAQPRRLVDARFISVLRQIKVFHRRARALLASAGDTGLRTYGEFLTQQGFTRPFIELYAVPLVSCVWSTGSETALDYPARYLFQFLSHHGMLAVTGSPQWYTVVGGSRRYVEAIAGRLADFRLCCPVTSISRDTKGVWVADASGGSARYDQVVIAVHANHALSLLADPSANEKAILSAFRYTSNQAILHTDDRLLPRARAARASWNYLVPPFGEGDQAPVVTYWMNRLQGLDAAEQYLVTLNAGDRIDPDKVVATMTYEHPVYDPVSVRARARLPALRRGRTAYAGAYDGWGFHEDGCRSGAVAARSCGVMW